MPITTAAALLTLPFCKDAPPAGITTSRSIRAYRFNAPTGRTLPRYYTLLAETNGLPAMTNRSGCSIAFLMPMRGVAAMRSGR